MKAIWTCFVKAEIEEVIRALNGAELKLKKKSREKLARRLQQTLDNQEPTNLNRHCEKQDSHQSARNKAER